MRNKNGRPGEWTICTKCSGEGHHSQHLGAFSRAEFDEAFTPEEQADYMAGGYDKLCERCRGSGKLWIDLGPHLAEGERDSDGLCPCRGCWEQREGWRREEARMRWIESGCPDDFYYEG